MSETSMIALTATKQLQNVRAGGSVGKPIPNTRAKIISIDDPKGEFWNDSDSPISLVIDGSVFVKNCENFK